MSKIYKKVGLIGDFGVGKTSLIRRYIDNQFSDQYLSTIGVKISRKGINLFEDDFSGNQLQLIIWDIEGRTHFQSITQNYLQGLQGAIIVADLSRQDSIDHLQDHIELVKSVNANDIVLVIVLNKVDLFSNDILQEKLFNISTNMMLDIDKINQDFTIQLAELTEPSFEVETAQSSYHITAVVTTSAKTGKNVEKMFTTLSVLLLKRHRWPHQA